jgi:hypothetical protein
MSPLATLAPTEGPTAADDNDVRGTSMKGAGSP